MKKIIIESIYYNEASDKLKKDIAKLLSKVYGNTSNSYENSIYETHRQELNAKCFYCYNNNELVSYAAVIQKTINHLGTTFNIAGISSVATDINFRLQGIGTLVVREATKWIKNNKDIDFGIFTCNPSLINFYKSAGDWLVENNIVLIGSD